MLWELSSTDWIVLLSFLSGVSYITAWFCDRILTTTGFGNIGNWVLILAGAYGGMYTYNSYGYELHWNPLHTLAVIVGSALISLIVACLAKRFIFG